MLVFVKIPLFGTDITEAVIVHWLKQEGDTVDKEEEILEIETSKAVFTVQSSVSGKILKIFCNEGDHVKIFSPVCVVGTSDEDIFDDSVLYNQMKNEYKANNSRYSEAKLEQTKVETEISIKKGVRISPRAKRFIKDTGFLTRQWVMSHFLEGIVHEADVRELLSRIPIICIGAGPGIVRAFEIIRRQKKYKVVEIIDDDSRYWGKNILGVPIKRGLPDMPLAAKEFGIEAIYISVFSETRINLFDKVKTIMPEITILPLIDPTSNISTGVTIEEGVFIEAGVTIGTNVHIGKGSRINIGALVAHDSFLEPFVHVAPGGMMGGKVFIGANTLIGVGATINSGVVIGKNCIISNSSAVLNDIEDNLLVSGNPAVVITKSKREYNVN